MAARRRDAICATGHVTTGAIAEKWLNGKAIAGQYEDFFISVTPDKKTQAIRKLSAHRVKRIRRSHPKVKTDNIASLILLQQEIKQINTKKVAIVEGNIPMCVFVIMASCQRGLDRHKVITEFGDFFFTI